MKTFRTITIAAMAALSLAACNAKQVEVAADAAVDTTVGAAANAVADTASEVLNPTAPAADGAMCGGIAAVACGASSYCDMAGAQAAMPDAAGVCKPKPQMCTQQYEPVCGSDGKTYGNACTAASAGVTVASQGECGK